MNRTISEEGPLIKGLHFICNIKKENGEYEDAKALETAITWLKAPDEAMASSVGEYDEVYQALLRMDKEYKAKEEDYLRNFGHPGDPAMQEKFPMKYALDKFHGNIPGEEIFSRIESALDAAMGRDITASGYGKAKPTVKEILRYYDDLQPQDVLISLKREAETTGTRKGATVLYGTMKYETQKDRKEAYKWAKKWMNKSAKELDHEVCKVQKNESQGR